MGRRHLAVKAAACALRAVNASDDDGRRRRRQIKIVSGLIKERIGGKQRGWPGEKSCEWMQNLTFVIGEEV